MASDATYDTSWDSPHQPGDDPHWQESDAYWFFDAERGIGGFHRIGQRPNQEMGQLTAFAFACEGSRFVLNDTYTAERRAGTACRNASGQSLDGHSVVNLGDGVMRFTWDEPDSRADLVFSELFYEPRDWSRDERTKAFMARLNPDGHLEVSGRLRGTLSIAGDSFTVDALCHRDRSWGHRDSASISMHRYRMFSGTCGPELSFATFRLDTVEGEPVEAGFVVRNGVEEEVTGVRILTTFDADGFSPVGATGLLTLASSEVVRISCTAVQGFMTMIPAVGMAMSDTICTFRYGDKTGFLDLELVNNPQRGRHLPGVRDVSLLSVAAGVSDSVGYPSP